VFQETLKISPVYTAFTTSKKKKVGVQLHKRVMDFHHTCLLYISLTKRMENARHVPTNKYSTNDLRAKELPFFLLLNKEDDDSLARLQLLLMLLLTWLTVATFINVATTYSFHSFFIFTIDFLDYV
jgi:hypothetical protein